MLNIAFSTLASLHVDYARPWVLVSLGLLAFDFMMRLVKMRVVTAVLTPQAGETTKVEIQGIRSDWRAGQHVWIRRLQPRFLHEGM